MASLLNSANQILLPELRVASRMWDRMRGLLGTKGLGEGEGLWIHRCNSIHTFFMNYPIDCVFVDSSMTVKALKADVVPGRVVLPVWGAVSVIEMKSGKIRQLGLNIGDQLHVGA